MRKFEFAVLAVLMCSLTISAGSKQKGTTTLKDLQPAGTIDKKNKNQIYDLTFTAAGNNYTCRTSHETKLQATDFIVGENVGFELDGDNGKLKNVAGKSVKCKIVRVEKVAAPQN